MGLIDKLFGRKTAPPSSDYFRLLDGYSPVFRTFGGELYESELVRTAIDTVARHSGKLEITIQGEAKKSLRTQLVKSPNTFQTWNQFLYRTRTILENVNTAFIVPSLNEYGETTGIYPIAPCEWDLVQTSTGVPWIRFKFRSGDTTAFRLSEVGIITKYQYKSDLFGEDNRALHDTMNLIEIQRQGITESVKNSASYRFMAKVGNFTKAEDLKRERQRFNDENFRGGDGGGVLLFPNTYNDIREVSQHSYNVDEKQLSLIQTNVFNYFGVNADVLQNKAYGDAWSAFYEGAIEPFAIQLSEVLTKMLFTSREIAQGNQIFFTANRLQYMTNADKLNVATQMVDRGLMSLNEAREIWNLPPVDGGDERIIRGEYYTTDDKLNEGENDGEEE